MRRQAFHGLLAGVLLGAATIYSVHAQTGPAATNSASPGGGGGQGFSGRGQFSPPGPPAPVPPEVTMAHPTQAEVDKINADVKKFIETSKDKRLLQKYESLLTVSVLPDNPCIRPAPGVRARRHQGFVDIANTNDFDILFDGDSITDFWRNRGPRGGADVFQKYFGNLKIANFGVSGDRTQGVLWGLQHGEGQGHKPKAVMLMIGTNNTGDNSGPEIAEGIGAIIYELRKDFPDAKILLLAIFPKGDSGRLKNEAANKIIAKLDDGKHVFFMNINDKFLDAQGRLIGFNGDNLHPNAQGYEIWASAVAPTLTKWIQ